MPLDKLDRNLVKALEEMEIDSGQEVLEVPPAPEALPEKVFEKTPAPFEIREEIIKPPPLPKPTSPSLPAAPTVILPKSQLHLAVEGILEEGLGDVYFKLPPEKREEFKKAGEVTSLKITQMLQHATWKIKEIFHLILKWLRIIPGVNKYFLEQEAKIKSDRILALKKRMEK